MFNPKPCNLFLPSLCRAVPIARSALHSSQALYFEKVSALKKQGAPEAISPKEEYLTEIVFTPGHDILTVCL